MSDEHRLLRAFLEETEELLEKLNHCLLELEKDSANLELVHEIFRLTHSLKSESAMIGFANLSELAHRLEDVFERLRSGALLLRRELLDAVLGASDLMQEMVARIAGGEGDVGVDTGALTVELARLAGLPDERAPAAPRREAPPVEETGQLLSGVDSRRAREALERGEKLYSLSFRTAGEPAMRYPRAYLVFSNLERVANVLKSIPELDLQPEDGGDGYGEVRILFSSDLPEAELRKAYRLEDIEEARLVRLKPDFLNSPLREGGPQAAAVPNAAEQARAVEAPAEGAAPRGAPEPGSRGARTSVRVDTAKLDDLWQLVGELVTCKARFGKLTAGLRPDRDTGAGPAKPGGMPAPGRRSCCRTWRTSAIPWSGWPGGCSRR